MHGSLRLEGPPTAGGRPAAVGFGPDLANVEEVLAHAATLADSGRMLDARELTRRAASVADGPDAQIALAFMAMAFSVISAQVDDALDSIRLLDTLPTPPESLAWARQCGHWLLAVTGAAKPRDLSPPRPADAGITAAGAAHAIWQLLGGDCVGALGAFDAALESRAGPGQWLGAEAAAASAWSLWATRSAYGPALAIARAPHEFGPDTRITNRWLGPFRQGLLAEAHMATGDLGIAAMLFDEALVEAEGIGSGWMSSAVADRALLDLHLGRLDRAGERLDAWAARALPDLFGFPDIELARAELHRLRGEDELAHAAAAGAFELAARQELTPWVLARSPMLARQASLSHDFGLLRQIAARTELCWGAAHAPALESAVLLTRAMAAGDHRLAQRAAVGFQSTGDLIAETMAFEEASYLAARTDPDVSRELAERTLELAERIGSVTVSHRLRSRLRALGIVLGHRTGHRDADRGWESLTARELAVTMLVADGLTGPKIASQLAISPRTVQSHVSHAMSKLGVATRTELAAVAIRRRARG
ncbi:helix-turn-helix transcriptional regulator [Tomitella biformata]|uniref:helix-turn-helix transcriptional regulator n=1 Tax=Tomitella biformata TaxID=630403 RepID=UPI0004637B75|nr:LuxR family transcriptional regulator [Tomitella biformata]